MAISQFQVSRNGSHGQPYWRFELIVLLLQFNSMDIVKPRSDLIRLVAFVLVLFLSFTRHFQ